MKLYFRSFSGKLFHGGRRAVVPFGFSDTLCKGADGAAPSCSFKKRLSKHALRHFLVVWLGAWPLLSWSQVQVVPDETLPAVFAGAPQKIKILFRNPGEKTAQADLRTRIFQVSSATLMPVGDAQPWKKLEVLPGQTVIESATLTFPEIKTGARFQVQWLDDQNKIIGRTDLLVYPQDLLKQLKTLAGDKPLGLRDSSDQLKPLLKQAKVEFEDLEKEGGLDAFHGRLAIAIFTSKEQAHSETREHFFLRVKQDLALVWIQPIERKASAPVIPAHVTRLGAGAVVIAEPSAIANLKDSALSQLNLLGFAELALNPDSPLLPNNP
ncbi:MAG: hypothetical protein HY360_00620 [Verrucomicrobia bacterium]|nr:hypothetical protein [Verrucomicrobiota bacterium]